MSLAIAIMACPRPAPNVHSTLAGMVLADPSAARHPLIVSWDGEGSHELAPYKRHADVRALDAAEAKRRTGLRHDQRTNLNFLACLKAAPPGADLIVLQDDLELAPRWLTRLRAIVEEVREAYGARFAVAGYYRFSPETVRAAWAAHVERLRAQGAQVPTLPGEGSAWQLHPPGVDYAGNLLTYWPASVVPEIVAGLEAENGAAAGIAPDDAALHAQLWGRRIPLAVAAPSLCQHWGVESIANPQQGRDRQAPAFG